MITMASPGMASANYPLSWCFPPTFFMASHKTTPAPNNARGLWAVPINVIRLMEPFISVIGSHTRNAVSTGSAAGQCSSLPAPDSQKGIVDTSALHDSAPWTLRLESWSLGALKLERWSSAAAPSVDKTRHAGPRLGPALFETATPRWA